MESNTIFIIIAIIGGFGAFVFYKIVQSHRSQQQIAVYFGDETPYQFDKDMYASVKRYYHFVKSDGDIDDITWNDLNMDAIYNQINKSMSSVGDEFLYAHLRKQTHTDLDSITNYSDRFDKDISFRNRVQKAFVKLGRVPMNGFSDQLFDGRKAIPTQFQYTRFQALLAFLPLVIFPFSGIYAMFTFVAVFVLNLFTYYNLNKEIRLRLRSLNYFVSMLKCSRDIEKNTDIKVPGLDSFRSIKSYLNVVNVSMDDGTGAAAMAAALNAYFCLYSFSFMKIINAINNNAQDAQNIYETLGMLELAYSRASLIQYTPHCIPTFTMDPAPKVTAIAHPLIKNPVKNSVDLGKNMLVTGSNASGKSTFVRSVAINVILGQRLNLCYAESMSFRKCHVATSMAISDDIGSGDSYFVAEIKSIKRLLEAVETYDYSLLVIDEILKGTNTIERIAASASILDTLKDKPCFVCAATHDIELVNILNQAYTNVHFREIIDSDGIHFDYKIQEGPSNTRNAIKLLDYYDYDEALVKKANDLADVFTKSKKWDRLG